MRKYKDLRKKWKRLGTDVSNLVIFAHRNCIQEAEELATDLGKIYYEKLGLKRDFEECFLALEYPISEDERDYQRFFDSPEVMSRNQIFEGVFVIYLKQEVWRKAEETVTMLLDYMEENLNDKKFIFIVDEDEKKEKIVQQLGGKYCLERYDLDIPSAGVLMECAQSAFGEKGYQLNASGEEILMGYFMEQQVNDRDVLGKQLAQLYVNKIIDKVGMKGNMKLIEGEEMAICLSEIKMEISNEIVCVEEKTIGF